MQGVGRGEGDPTALCGHGHVHLANHEKSLHGDMVDDELPDEAIAEAMKSVSVPRLTPLA